MNRAYLYIILIFILTIQNLLGQSNLWQEPINGISFLGPYQPSLHFDMFEKLKETNADWVALIPEAVLERATLKLKPDAENKHWGFTIAAQIEGIKLAKKAGFKTFLKPHIILEKQDASEAINQRFFTFTGDKTNGAEWRGTFKANNEADWKTWESSYETYILNLATIAESLEVDLFCIGTEMKTFVIERPKFWRQLIQKIRARYNGSLTYSANWDEFDSISFWDDLDVIGINSYFPINFSKTPKINATLKNWKPIKDQLKSLSTSLNKKILFTEFGYRNVSFSGASPWLHDKGNVSSNNKAQANLYEAFFQTFWNESWVVGGFCWNWQPHIYSADNTDFTVQFKPAFSILQKWYL